MIRTKRWMTAIGSAILAGVLVASVAFAHDGDRHPRGPEHLSPGVHELMKEIHSLRQARMVQIRAEIEALIDKAAAEGRITPEEAKQLKEHGRHMERHHKRPHDQKGDRMIPKGATEESVKARLEEAVKNGRMTREQADQILKRWKEMQTQKPSRTY